MKINFGLIAVPAKLKFGESMSILHFCGYESKPTVIDIAQLKAELRMDPEFRLTVPFKIKHAPARVVRQMREKIEANERAK